ncbi:unnamed protein product [Caenorhabditis sp. 36 PRJEB53466]|nr:unnamed protein product [Caenorhabditis sp. 36 PRJEB53466]
MPLITLGDEELSDDSAALQKELEKIFQSDESEASTSSFSSPPTHSAEQSETYSDKQRRSLEGTSKIKFDVIERPEHGTLGKELAVRANYFPMTVPNITVHRYRVEILPKGPRDLNRKILAHLLEKYSNHFNGLLCAYDGREFLYAKRILPIGAKKTLIELLLPDANQRNPFQISIEYLAEVQLEAAMNGQHEAVHALQTILSHIPGTRSVQIGKSFFKPLKKHYDLTGGLELWQGHYQAVRPTQMRMLLMVDPAASSFLHPQSVLGYLCDVLQISEESLRKRTPLNSESVIKFGKEMKEVKIEMELNGMKRKHRVLRMTHRPAAIQTFPMYQGETNSKESWTVEDYYKMRYEYKLIYPHLPCLQVGKQDRNTYIPMELCKIVTCQRYQRKQTDEQTSRMIRRTVRLAPATEREIHKILKFANFENDAYASEFGVAVGTSMVELSGRRLPAPWIQYSSRTPANVATLPEQGAWDMSGRHFHTAIKLATWAMICFAPESFVSRPNLRSFTHCFREWSGSVGMHVTSVPSYAVYACENDQVEHILQYIVHVYPNIQLVMAILPGKTHVYNEMKRVADTKLGLPTQCVDAKNVKKTSRQTVLNICQKINMKLGGVNSVLAPSYRFPILQQPTIFIGLHISRPPKRENNKPSTVSAVGSIDAHPSRYAASIRLQDQHPIVALDLTSMMCELLKKFYRSTGFKPTRIVFYREGVAEENMYNVLQYELRAIRNACKTLETKYEPGITFIAVKKRHHTRLFPVHEEDMTGESKNVPPGTCVDHGICHPNRFDFYLCSHVAVQGTARPTHYHVLWDDSRLSANDLQQMTHHLCYTYARCTRAVSVPAPVYYALLAAFRAQYHLNLEKWNEASEDGSSTPETDMEKMNKVVKIHPNAVSSMYFV